MAIYYARATGNVNSSIWATTPTGTASNLFSSFTNADTLVANSFTVTFNVNTTVLEIKNDTTGGATNGGIFGLANNITLTANVIGGNIGGSNACIIYSLASPNSATVIGNISCNPTSTSSAISNSSTGTLNIIGNVTGASVSTITNTSTGTINIIGNILGGYASGGYGVLNNSSGTVNITGSVTGGFFSGAQGSAGIRNASTGNVNITGNVFGGSALTTYGAENNSTGTITIIGSATASNTSIAAINSSTGTLNVTRAVGNNFGLGTSGMTSQPGVASNTAGSLTNVEEIEYGSLGQSPTSGPIRFVDKTSNVALFYRGSSFSTKKTLVDSSIVAGGVPTSSDVRSGVSYNLGANIGSCIIPNANSVVFGVPVDNISGSGVLSPASVWNYLVSNISTSGTIGSRMKNCATVASVGKQLEQVL